jgi:hypothetical protein
VKKAASIFIILTLFIVSCSSTVKINSDPQGATVYIDGEKKGVTPYEHTDTKTIFSTTSVTLKKDGYDDLHGTLTKDKFSVGPCIGGFFLLVPFLWIMEYPAEKNFELSKKEEKGK